MIIATTGFIEKAWQIFIENWPLFWYGTKITILLAVAGTCIGLLIGLLFGGIRAIKIEKRDPWGVKAIKRILHAFVGFYVWFIRGTPMMVQAMFFYYGLRPVLHWTPLVAGICIISINTGAYMAEIIRSGIQSVDPGQSEAARSLGMSNTQTMLSIILPQAIRNAFPSIGNELIVNIKDSSMLNVISVVEVFFQSTSVAGSLMLFTETFISTCAIYLILTSIASWFMGMVEKKLQMPKSSHPTSVSMPIEKKGDRL